MQQSALLITTWEGYGDLVYHTPTIRTFSKYFKHLDVWCRRSEPFLNNPYIRNLQTYKDDFPKPPDIYNDRTFIVRCRPISICPILEFIQWI